MIGCLLDMDGVLSDFVGAMSKAHNKPNPFLDGKNAGKYDLAKIWGIPEKEFWKPTNFVNFWADMKKTREADELVIFIERKFGKDNVAILTAPSEHPASIVGKMEWINRNYPQFDDRIIIAKCKDFLAHYDNVLIDDKDSNVDDFKAAGGRAVLMPRYWNSRHKDSKFTLACVAYTIESMNIIKTKNVK
jgi:5'(3')-deoxyribonucleotidase